jgi:hypothetical protein
METCMTVTAEVALDSFFSGSTVLVSELPITMTAVNRCYRAEKFKRAGRKRHLKVTCSADHHLYVSFIPAPFAPYSVIMPNPFFAPSHEIGARNSMRANRRFGHVYLCHQR